MHIYIYTFSIDQIHILQQFLSHHISVVYLDHAASSSSKGVPVRTAPRWPSSCGWPSIAAAVLAAAAVKSIG